MPRRPLGKRPVAAPAPPPPPASALFRRRLAEGVVVVGLLAVLLTAGGAPAALRAPVDLLAALVVPGYAVVCRVKAPAAAVVGLTFVVSLAIETFFALVLVQLRFWHPAVLALALAAAGISAALGARASFASGD